MFRFHRSAVLAVFSLTVVPAFLSSCAPSNEKAFQPYVVKEGNSVRAISEEEASTLCEKNYCEPNQLYTANFGRKRRTEPVPIPITEPSPSPVPSVIPSPNPSGQPAEVSDYARNILKLDEAWSITEGSKNVIVAVVDSGVAYTHPDLAENIHVNTAELNGRPGVDDDGNGYFDDVYGYDFYNSRPNGFDDNGHGTHVAGTIGAAKNGIGVRGVSPKVKILPLKFLGANGSGDTADAVAAIDYAVAMGAKVISNSWGGGGYSQLLDQAIQRAISKGVLFVAAAGNEANNNDSFPTYPANYANVISVGSSDSSDLKSSFSNYGNRSTLIMAPGSSIYSTYPGSTYKSLSGTSMATPQVSGAFALALSLGRSVTPSQLTQDLCDSASNRLTQFASCGRMDVGAFIRRVSQR